MNISTSTAVVTPPAIAGTRRPLLTPIPGTSSEFLMVIDNSSLEKFTMCPREAEFYLVRSREPHAKNAALVFGGAIHAGLELFGLGASSDEQDARVVEFFTNNPAPPDYRNVNTALEVLKHYRIRATFPDYDQEILKDTEGNLLVERSFELPLGSLEINANVPMPWLSPEDKNQLGPSPWVSHVHVAWSGRMDLIAHTVGKNRVGDYKTTSIAGSQVIDEYHMASPTRGYVWASRQLYPQHDIRSLFIDFIHLKKPGATGSYAGSLTAKGPRGGDAPLNFFRAYYDYTLEAIDAWENNTLHVVSDFLAHLTRGFFPEHNKQCVRKYGRCPYYDLCIEGNEKVRQQLLYSDLYKQVTWNPTAER